MPVLDIATGLLVAHLQEAAAPETSQAEHDARLVAQVHNATIALCQRCIRDAADALEQALADNPSFAALVPGPAYLKGYRNGADLLEALRT